MIANDQVVADIVALSPALVAIIALLLNYRGFASIDSRFSAIENRLNLMQQDLKDLYKTMAALEVDVALVKDKLKMP